MQSADTLFAQATAWVQQQTCTQTENNEAFTSSTWEAETHSPSDQLKCLLQTHWAQLLWLYHQIDQVFSFWSNFRCACYFIWILDWQCAKYFCCRVNFNWFNFNFCKLYYNQNLKFTIWNCMFTVRSTRIWTIRQLFFYIQHTYFRGSLPQTHNYSTFAVELVFGSCLLELSLFWGQKRCWCRWRSIQCSHSQMPQTVQMDKDPKHCKLQKQPKGFSRRWKSQINHLIGTQESCLSVNKYTNEH